MTFPYLYRIADGALSVITLIDLRIKARTPIIRVARKSEPLATASKQAPQIVDRAASHRTGACGAPFPNSTRGRQIDRLSGSTTNEPAARMQRKTKYATPRSLGTRRCVVQWMMWTMAMWWKSI